MFLGLYFKTRAGKHELIMERGVSKALLEYILCVRDNFMEMCWNFHHFFTKCKDYEKVRGLCIGCHLDDCM